MDRPTGDLDTLYTIMYGVVEMRLDEAKMAQDGFEGVIGTLELVVTPDIPVYKPKDVAKAIQFYVKPEYLEVVEKNVLDQSELIDPGRNIPEEELTDLIGRIDPKYLQVPKSIYDLPTFIMPEMPD